MPASPWEAALGAKVTVPTLKESILLTIPPGSRAGQRLRVKGKGLVSKKQAKRSVCGTENRDAAETG